jgi:hypothetical protein
VRGGEAPSHISLPLSHRRIIVWNIKELCERGIKGVR